MILIVKLIKKSKTLRRWFSKDLAIRRASFNDLITVWAGTFVGAIAGIATQMLLARMLGAEDYGTFSSALGLVTLAVPLCVFGIAQHWLKIFGEDGWDAVCWLRPSLQFLAVATSVIVLALVLWAVFGPNEARARVAICILLPVTISLVLVEMIGSKFQLEQRYGPFAILGATTPVLRLLVVSCIVFVFSDGDALLITIIGYAISSLFVVALLVPQLRDIWLQRIDLVGHFSKCDEPRPVNASVSMLVSKSWVFGVAGLLYLAWAQGHVVIAQYALGNQNAGYYNAALVVLNAVCLLPTAAFSKFLLPKIHRWAAQDFEKLKIFGRTVSALMFIIGIIVATVLFFCAPLAIRAAFGPGFEVAAGVLQILSLAIPTRFLAYSAGAMLRTQKLMRIKIMLLLAAVIANFILIRLLIPHWGVYGLAATVPITELILFSAYVYIMEFYYFRGRQL